MKAQKNAMPLIKKAQKAASQGNPDTAEGIFLSTWREFPKSEQLLVAVATGLIDLGRDEQAMKVLDEAAQHLGNTKTLYMIIGEMALRMNLPALAEKAYRQACLMDQSDSANFFHLAQSLKLSERQDEAIELLQSSLELFPNEARLWDALGNLLIEHRQDLENGQIFLRQAVNLEPTSARLLHNLATKLYSSPEAAQYYEAALAIEPDNAQLNISYAIYLFANGEPEKAWPYYEYRNDPELGKNKAVKYGFSIPQWKGETLTGKSILVCPEQGIGDEVLFALLLPKLTKQAGKVYLATDPRLVSLMQRSFPQITVVDYEDTINFRYRVRSFPGLKKQINNKEIDYTIPIGSLARYLAPTRPEFKSLEGGFFVPDPKKVDLLKKEVSHNHGVKIAISWRSGNMTQERKHFYFPTEIYRRICPQLNIDFYVFQYSFTEEERNSLKDIANIHFLDQFDLKNDIETNIALLSHMCYSLGPPTAMQMFAMATPQVAVNLFGHAPPWTLMNTSEMGANYHKGSRFFKYSSYEEFEGMLMDYFRRWKKK